MLTFTSGGWVLVLAALVTLALVAWAVAPAVFRIVERPPGDGENIESYGFDLTTCVVPRTEIAAAMLHRDMVPVMDDPELTSADAIDDVNAERRGKFLVASDEVVGVEIDGAARAYPIAVLNVHDIVNDTLGGRPIAVTYSWLTGSVRVFDREAGGRVVLFGVSGLVYNSNLLMYDRTADGTPGAESLWSQLQGRAVTGAAAEDGERLRVIPSVRTSWEDWKTHHPDTTVILEDARLGKRYKHAAPTSYLNSPEVKFPYAPALPEGDPPPKTRVVAVITDGARRVYRLNRIGERAGADGVWTDRLGDTALTFTVDTASSTVTVSADPPGNLVEAVPAFWFAWHAMYPEDELAD